MAIDGTDLRTKRRELESALTDALARGEADLSALDLSARLGAITAAIGNRHEARRHFSFVASAGPAVLGANHPLVRQADAFLDAPPRPELSRLTPAIRPANGEIERVLPSQRGVVALTRQEHELQRPQRDGALGWRTRRRSLIWAVSASAALACITAAVAALWAGDRNGRPAINPNVSAPAVRAPQHVVVTMTNGVVTVRWQDPASGAAPFIISGGVAGAIADLRQQVAAGQTSVVINGLNPSRDYCFTVVAVYSPERVAISDLACTKR